MNKKLIGLLLALALVIGLLPAMALADDPVLTEMIRVMSYTDLKASTDGKSTYLKNEEVDCVNGEHTFKGTKWTVVGNYTATEPAEWNVKFSFPAGGTPTLTLKGAILDYYDEEKNVYSTHTSYHEAITGKTSDPVYDLNIVIEKDSYIATNGSVVVASNLYGNVTVSSVGDAKLTTHNYKGIGSNGTLTLNNANLDMWQKSYAGGSSYPLYGKTGLTINGGTYKLASPTEGGANSWEGSVGALIYSDGDIVINSGNFDLETNYYSLTNLGAIQSKKTLTINDGTFNIKHGVANGLGATNGITMNGGTIVAESTTGYFLNSGNPMKMNGGSLTAYKANNALHGANLLDISGYSCCVIKAGTAKDGSDAAVQDAVKNASYISVTPYALTEVKAKEASCKEDGNIAYWTCAKCGKYYSDAAGATEITDKESVKISKDTVQCKPEADDGDCTTAIKCSVCGKETTPANAAHTAGAWTDGKTNCTVCNKEFACTHTGGTATCEKKAVCTTCGEEYGELAAHTPAEDDGDCTTAVKCTVCGEDARPAGTHTGGTATCKAKAKCTNCGQEYGELAAHTPAEDDGDCSTAIKCTVCGAETTAAKTHVEEVIPGKAATKTETGLTEGKKCSTCGKILVAQKEIAKLPADGTNGNPATGDSHIAVWMGLMAVSAAAFVSIVVMGKKKIA